MRIIVYLLLEITSDKESTEDSFELRETVKLRHGSVVLDGQVTENLGNAGERDVAELVVANEGNAASLLGVGTDLSKVLGLESFQVRVVSEAESRDLLERRDAEGSNTSSNSDILCLFKNSHVDFHVLAVLVENKSVTNLLQVGVEHLQLRVGGDLEGVDLGQVEAAEVTERSVRNLDGLSLGASLTTETDGGKLLERNQGELVDGVELVHADVTEHVISLDIDGIPDLSQVTDGQTSDALVLLDNDATSDLLNAAD